MEKVKGKEMNSPFRIPQMDWWPASDKPKHPFWHLCTKCASWLKIAIVWFVLNGLEDFATFKPFHWFYETMGWIK